MSPLLEDARIEQQKTRERLQHLSGAHRRSVNRRVASPTLDRQAIDHFTSMLSTPANPGRRVTFHDATRPATAPRPAHRPPAHRFAARQKPIATTSPLPPLLTLSTSGLVADPTANPTTDPTECSPMAGNRTSWLTYIHPSSRQACNHSLLADGTLALFWRRRRLARIL